MENINVEKIMEEIREDIIKKGLTNDMLSFSDVVLDDDIIRAIAFNKIAFNEELYLLNRNWNIQPYKDLGNNQGIKNKIKVLLKKIIRKMIKFYVEPVVYEQDTFNASVVKSMNLINSFIDQKNKEIEKLQEEIEKLKQENNN